MILQAFDFYKLFEREKCLLQLGGSDQWGNIVNGVDLIRRILKKRCFWPNKSINNLILGC